MAEAAQGTIIAIAGAAGSPVTATAGVAGYPTILTRTGHGLSVGDVVTLSGFTGVDAALLNGQVAVVQFVTANTFAVGIDTTGKTITFTGKATPKNWTDIGEVVDMDRAAGSRSEIDTTHLTSTSKEVLLGLRDSGTYTFSINWVFDDAGQLALLAAEGSDTVSSFKVTYPSGNTLTFDGFVQSVSGPSLAVDDKLSGTVTIRISGDVVFA